MIPRADSFVGVVDHLLNATGTVNIESVTVNGTVEGNVTNLLPDKGSLRLQGQPFSSVEGEESS